MKLFTKSFQSNDYNIFDYFIYDIKSNLKPVFLFKFVEKIVYILVIGNSLTFSVIFRQPQNCEHFALMFLNFFPLPFMSRFIFVIFADLHHYHKF